MNLFKKQIIKYILLLVGFYIGIRLLAITLLTILPDLMTIHYSESSSRTLSSNYLVSIFEYLTNLILAIIINRDLRANAVRSVPVLIVTCLYDIAGVVLYLILLFAHLYKPKQLIHDNN